MIGTASMPGEPGGSEATSPENQMTLPPLQFTSSSASKSGDLSQTMAFDSSGFSVNYGSGVSQGGAVSAVNPLIIGALILAGAVWMKKST
jgi:hypothetical protein